LSFNGKPYQWTSRALPDDIRVPLFEAFTSGASVKSFIATPKDATRCAATIARLERERGQIRFDLESLCKRRRKCAAAMQIDSSSGTSADGFLRTPNYMHIYA